MRFGTMLVVFLLFALAISVPHTAAQYTISTLSISLDTDGFATLNYYVATDPTTANITLPLIGAKLTDLIITDQNNVPLNYQMGVSSVLIYTLGSDAMVSYSTSSLTDKKGDLWSLNFTSPVSFTALLPIGATLVSMSPVPLQISTVGGRQSVMFPDGPNEITYEIGIVGTREHALLVITDAEAAIYQAKTNNLVTTYADSLLTKAKSNYNSGNYVAAEDYGNQAKQAVITLTALAGDADAKIKTASTLIEKAKSEGRTNGIDAVVTLLESSQVAYSVGNYTKASTLATQAITSVGAATRSFDYLLIGGGLLVVFGVIVVAFFLRRGNKSESLKSSEVKGIVDIGVIFGQFPDLREDDKQVIILLADSGGETYSDLIRKKLQMPKTSAWRLIKRLSGLGIVGVRNVGGRSLVYVVSKFRKGLQPNS